MVHIRIEEIEKYAEDYNIPIMLKDGIDFLTQYIKDNKVKNILEIGSAIGYSAIKMALVDKKINVTTIERDLERYNLAVKNINEFNLNEQIKIINGDALETEIDGEFDLIFIDAAKAQYIKFFEKYKKNLSKNGVIISDNLSFHGLVDDDTQINNRNTKQLVKKIRKYIDYLKNNPDYKTMFYKLGDGVAISIKLN